METAPAPLNGPGFGGSKGKEVAGLEGLLLHSTSGSCKERARRLRWLLLASRVHSPISASEQAMSL